MAFLIIKELLKENFFFNGTVYLEKQIKDPGKRKPPRQTSEQDLS